jgi:O-antigen/teichoic acid export membrane protein
VGLSRPLVLALTPTFLLWIWMSFHSIALNAAGVLRPQMLLIGAHAVLNLALAVPAARMYGPAGVAWANFLTGVVTSLWGYPWLVRRYIFNAAAPNAQVPPTAPPPT